MPGGVAGESADGAFAEEAAESAYTGPTADADKATSFGSAVHQTCEWMALHPQMPDETAVREAALRFARQWEVHDTDRLLRAVGAWAQSDLCREAFACTLHEPELPFVTDVDGRVLEGSIDLFCTSNPNSEAGAEATARPRRALVIDYKTGGSSDETAGQLHTKHLLQAQCYAYAALDAGYQQVSLRFVRVEQLDAAGQPQVVPYEFNSADLPALHDAITSVAANAQP